MYGKQNPIIVCMVRLTEVEPEHRWLHEARGGGGGGGGLSELHSWDFAFQVHWDQFVWTDSGHWDPEWVCRVLPHATYTGENRLVADGDWLSLDVVQSFFIEPPLEPVEDMRRHEVAPTFEKDVYSQNPWVADFLKWNQTDERGHNTNVPKSASQARGGGRAEAPFAEMLDAEAVMDALLAKRAEVEVLDEGEAAPDFAIGVRGGQ